MQLVIQYILYLCVLYTYLLKFIQCTSINIVTDLFNMTRPT